MLFDVIPFRWWAKFIKKNFAALNGYAYGNLEGLDVCLGDNVIWHVLSFGQTEGNHVVTFNGNNVAVDGQSKDSRVIISGQTFTALMRPDNVGEWHVVFSFHYAIFTLPLRVLR